MAYEYTDRVSQEQQDRFEQAVLQAAGSIRERSGIGTLTEKTVHAIVKYYYEPDRSRHEIAIEKNVADIFTGSEIIEVQTRSLYRLKEKLERFLPLFPVTVVYPMVYHKWLCWIDEETGEISKRRKSPKTGTFYEAFRELYTIQPFLKEPGFQLRLLMMDVEEYRLLNGWSRDRKRGSTREDRIPTRLEEEVELKCPRDYLLFLPMELPETFTSGDLAKAAKISRELAGITLKVLTGLSVVERVGKKGNSILYQIPQAYRL